MFPASSASARLRNSRASAGGRRRAIAALRDHLENALLERVSNRAREWRPRASRPEYTNISFPGAGGEALLIALDLQGVECSTGAACSSGSTEPSHVLAGAGFRAMMRAPACASASAARPPPPKLTARIEIIPGVVERIRALSPRHAEAQRARAR